MRRYVPAIIVFTFFVALTALFMEVDFPSSNRTFLDDIDDENPPWNNN